MATLAIILSISGCSHVILVQDPPHRIFTEPVYEEQMAFFFFGLVGLRDDIYLDKICLGKEAIQVSTVYTIKDVLSTIFTLGIYSPRSVRVWCAI